MMDRKDRQTEIQKGRNTERLWSGQDSDLQTERQIGRYTMIYRRKTLDKQTDKRTTMTQADGDLDK